MSDVIRLLVVDDSKMMRDSIIEIFSYGTNVQIVAQAENGLQAIEAVQKYKPDVITMDVSMPLMDGITALKYIMIKNPTPTIMLSSLTLEGARVAFDALRFGAVDFISKPSAIEETGDLSEQEAEIRSKIESAAMVEMSAVKYIRKISTSMPNQVEMAGQAKQVVAIGASEGGYGALLKIIPHLNANISKSYLVTLYASREHIDAFASYINGFSQVQVKRATHGEVLRLGVCYLNSGMDYLTVHKKGESISLHLSAAPFASRKGAIDMMLFSVADVFGSDSIGVVLSGMGYDGTEGIEDVSHRGGQVIVQSPESCLCKQMVENVMALNSGCQVVADSEIVEFIQ